ncbi:hypothetical protein LPTSP3_g09890 [Leptospira kobayashii]|uniref:Uncharacterized protein n=1 Tax=Leptospira kobayashii TaxID=1917830 RepID=A0ABM7UHP8_9LEPT|nr:hypothetical protein [Leptospira kobayashii]BDA78059.1 hypothetical protein LPTSP3_g09890 [Leptospira kobayashii]
MVKQNLIVFYFSILTLVSIFSFFPTSSDLFSQAVNSDQKISDETDSFDSPYIENFLPSPNKEKFEEQISCNKEDCIQIPFTKENKNISQIWNELGKNSGKVVVEIKDKNLKIDDESLEDLVEYLREISKRDGNVSFEPYYIGIRAFGFTDIPVFKDLFGVSYNIYKRIKSVLVFSRMKHYNAKVLYHPVTHEIMLFYFFHKNYGNLCDTVYSTCTSLQYVDDDFFDFQLSQALSKSEKNNAPIEIKFQQVSAELPQVKLDIDHLLAANRSSRLYKWLIASKETDTKKIKQERFLDLSLVVSILDYSLKAYEFVEAIQLYMPVRKMKSEVVYDDSTGNKVVKSVVFTKITK